MPERSPKKPIWNLGQRRPSGAACCHTRSEIPPGTRARSNAAAIAGAAAAGGTGWSCARHNQPISPRWQEISVKWNSARFPMTCNLDDLP
jgi:hypothetical protein